MKTTDYWTNDDDGYLERNRYLSLVGLKDFFTEALKLVDEEKIKSACEYGCNVGLNLRTLERLLPVAKIQGFDLNRDAVKVAGSLKGVKAKVGNLLESDDKKYDLVLTKGLLIHIHPDVIEIAYKNLYNTTSKYLLICEYYNPTPVEVEYHGKSGLLFKRDFAGDMMQMYPDLKLVSYGFRYHLDDYPSDDITYFLLKKETE